jgi:hypothetical protein
MSFSHLVYLGHSLKNGIHIVSEFVDRPQAKPSMAQWNNTDIGNTKHKDIGYTLGSYLRVKLSFSFS